MQSARKLPPAGPRLKKKILIVDDDEMSHEFISDYFDPNIYVIYHAYSGKEALALIVRFIDMVLIKL